MSDSNTSSRHILSIVGISFGILLALSALPWSRLTNNTLKDFNLFEDLFPSQSSAPVASTAPIVDPELEALINGSGDTGDGNLHENTAIPADTTASDTVLQYIQADPAPMIDGSVAIENYSSGPILPNLRQALAEASQRTVRIAVIGDSYIEGDIFCSHLRDILQQRYGGSGVGFMAAHIDFPGFRQTVNQSSKGWAMHDIRSISRRDTLRTLSGDYARADSFATTSFSARSKFPTTKSWDKTTFLFLTHRRGSISYTGAEGVKQKFDITPSDNVQAISIDGPTTKSTFSVSVPGIVSLGTYLDASAGVQLDCMSIRGNSGLATGRINPALCRQMAQWADYDLIIVEFGMNVLSAGQTDYTPYMQNMVKAITHLQTCYPHADILIMGVGDRGVKTGTEVTSLPTLPAMIDAQRETARRSGTYFWDTRAAMGGDKAVVEWRKRKLINADYIHLNHDGGGELATLFDIALKHALDE